MNLRPELTISSMIHPLSFVLTGAAVGIAASAEKNFGQMKTLLTPSDAAQAPSSPCWPGQYWKTRPASCGL